MHCNAFTEIYLFKTELGQGKKKVFKDYNI